MQAISSHGFVLLAARLFRGTTGRRGRQLKNGCSLPFGKPRQERDRAARKLERIVMQIHLVGIDLTEARNPPADSAVRQQSVAHIDLHIAVESDLSARSEAHGYVVCFHRRKAARERRGGKASGNKAVAHLCGAGRYAMKAIVTHGTSLLC